MAHLFWSQERFLEMLDCRSTFAIADDRPEVYHGEHSIEFYQQQPEGGAPQWTAELLDHYGLDRFSNPYIFLIIVMDPTIDFPTGGGRPCNGGVNTGGGIVVMSSFALDHHAYFQSTLQHELGHAFGLPHVNAYGYDMQTNASIMSYNPNHHTNGFEPSATPGTLIAEDIRGLAWNDRVLAELRFDPHVDIPPGYVPASPVWLGPMLIPGQVENTIVTSTPSGEAFGTVVQNSVQGWIKPNAGPGITFDPATMWCSEISGTEWVSVQLRFPALVTLDRMTIHSEHSGQYHIAVAARIWALIGGAQVLIAEQDLAGADAAVTLTPTASTLWTVELETGPSRRVVLRGLQFHLGADELFPPFFPEPVTDACRGDLNQSGAVDFGDLLLVLGTWDSSPTGPPDLDCSGAVGMSDLLLLLASWGDCLSGS